MNKPHSAKALVILLTAFTLLGVGCQKQIDHAPPKLKDEAPVVQPAVVNTYDRSTTSPSNYTELTKFSDQTLGITFEYPKYWGKIKTLLTCAPEGRLTKGCKYDMIFESSDKDMIIQSPVFNDGQFRIEAGGRSTDYQFGNEGTLLDDTRLASNKSTDCQSPPSWGQESAFSPGSWGQWSPGLWGQGRGVKEAEFARVMGPEKRDLARVMGPGPSACSRRVCAAWRTESRGRLPDGTATVAGRSDELSGDLDVGNQRSAETEGSGQ